MKSYLRDRPVVGVIGERRGAAEPNIPIDAAARAEEPQSLRFGRRHPIIAVGRVRAGQSADGGLWSADIAPAPSAFLNLRVAEVIEGCQALPEIARTQCLAAYFAVADVDVDRDRVGEPAFEKSDRICDRSFECRRRVVDARIITDIDDQAHENSSLSIIISILRRYLFSSLMGHPPKTWFPPVKQPALQFNGCTCRP